ncbi:MAG: biotin transporter BioY [Limosilactobacillus pontis]|nr:biotin transporter BioY [Limosilactobacillus pontis]
MKTKQLTLNAMMLAILIICSQVTIPLPGIPLTLQTFAIGMIATLLPLSDCLLTILTYLLIGTIGLPVFSNFSGGLPVLLSPLGGYLIGFLIYGLITSCILGLTTRTTVTICLANLLGASSQLVIGALWLIPTNHLTLSQAITIGVAPFVIPGILKLFLVVIVAQRLKVNQ